MKQELEGYRLSPQQRQLWRLQRGSSAYRARLTVDIHGVVDSGRLRRALESIVERHEILRIGFHTSPGIKLPIQIIGENASLHWQVESPGIDLGEVVAREDRHFFDHEQGPLTRAVLVPRGEAEQTLVVSFPSLCADRTTLDNFYHELAQGYDGDELEEPVQYLQFSEWQHEVLEDRAAAAKLQSRLNPASLTPVKLPSEQSPAKPSRFSPAAISAPLPEAVNAVADGKKEAVFLAAWQALLGRLTGRPAVVDVVVDGRPFEDLNTAMGWFSKSVPVVTQLGDETPFETLVAEVERQLDEARAIQESIDPEAERPWAGTGNGGSIAFETAVWPAAREVGGLQFSVASQDACGDRFKLKLVSVRRGDRGTSELHYDPALYHRAAAQEVLDRFHRLLEHAAHAPETAVGRLRLIGETERRELLAGLASGTAPEPGARLIHELFAARMARDGQLLALVSDDRQLTVAELDARADRLARRLRALGVGPDVPVAILQERSLESIVALLAVLKAGGAYVPLDPAQPAARLTLMLETVRPRVLLSAGDLSDKVSSAGISVLSLDDDSTPPPASDAAPRVQPSLSNLAYFLFTSGSTGHPKAVAVEHRQLLSYVTAVRQHLELEPGMSFATMTTLAADLGHTMIFPALAWGGCLHVVSEKRAADPEALAEYFARHEIDCLKIVPSHLRALATMADLGTILPRRRLVLGGEALSWSLAQRIREASPELAIYNHYGPTEATVGATVKRLGDVSGQERMSATVPIGRALGHAQVYLVDRHLDLVPRGIEGELLIGGAGVARCYGERPGVSAAVFVPNPFTREPGGRLYRTGDRACLDATGEIEFLGRIDFQINLRGFRIEPGEVEAALIEHPAVREAVVLVRGVSGENRLVAYLVNERGTAPEVSDLREHLNGRLPEYMTPSVFASLDALPLTANGKLDRTALPAPDLDRSALGDAYVAPRTPVEEILVETWSEVLKVDKVGIDDNFFSLGGDSMLSVRAVAMAKGRGMSLAVQDVFRNPTVRGLADRIEAILGLPAPEDEPEADAEPSEELAAILDSVESLSNDEVRQRLREVTRVTGEGSRP